jgi:hypothetical protein
MDTRFTYADLKYDIKTGSSKSFGKFLEAAREAAKTMPQRPVEEVLGTPFVSGPDSLSRLPIGDGRRSASPLALK